MSIRHSTEITAHNRDGRKPGTRRQLSRGPLYKGHRRSGMVHAETEPTRWLTALINEVGIWTTNPKFVSMEIYQNSLVARTGDRLSWKATCEQINFPGSQSTAELNTQKLCRSHLRISHLRRLLRYRPCYTRAILLPCSHQDVCGCFNSLVSVSTGVQGQLRFQGCPDTG